MSDQLQEEFRRAAEQFGAASDVLGTCIAMVHAIRKADSRDAARLMSVLELYAEDWAEIFSVDSLHFYDAIGGEQK
jgi:hypothetical protein